MSILPYQPRTVKHRNDHFSNQAANRLKIRKIRYILDEPEAALSAQSQLSLLCLIDDLVKQGSQFIIATHSTILISYRNAKILDLNNGLEEVKYQDTDIYQLYKLYMNNPEAMQDKLFDSKG